MSDRQKFDAVQSRLRIARTLSRIVELYLELHWQVMAASNDRDFPGGRALNMLAGATVAQDWQRVYDYLERRGASGLDKYADAQIADEEHPINVLGFWTRVIREERDQPTRLEPTVAREVDYLRKNLDWMVRVDEFNEPEWFEVTELEHDLKTLRRRMEDVLFMGNRDDKINARCNNDRCSRRPRLSVRVGMGHSGEDYWQCPACKQVYDEDGVARCWRTMFVERGDAPEWLPIRRAASAVGRPVSTVRSWTIEHHGKPAVVESKIENGRTHVRWADVRAKDDTSKRRGKTRQIA